MRTPAAASMFREPRGESRSERSSSRSSRERTAVGAFRLGQAITLDALEALSLAERRERLLATEALLGSRPRLTLETKVAAKFRHGQAVSVGSASGSVAVFSEDGMFLGTGEVDASGTLQPKRLLAPR